MTKVFVEQPLASPGSANNLFVKRLCRATTFSVVFSGDDIKGSQLIPLSPCFIHLAIPSCTCQQLLDLFTPTLAPTATASASSSSTPWSAQAPKECVLLALLLWKVAVLLSPDLVQEEKRATRLNPRNVANRSMLDTELGPGEKWTGLEKQGMDWNGSAELDWTGLEQEGMDCAGSVRVDWTGLDC